MENEEELLEILDENGNKTGKILTRRQAEENGLYVGAVTCLIVNSAKEILLEKRKDNGLWDFCSGHKKVEEDSISAITREIEEEIGLLKQKVGDRIKRITTIRHSIDYKKYITDVYVCRVEIPIEKLKIQKEEVTEIVYVPLNVVKELIKREKFRFPNNLIITNLINEVEYEINSNNNLKGGVECQEER